MAIRQQRPVTLRLRRTFKATRDRVFRAWTTPEEVTRWKGPGPLETLVADIDLRVGGRYRVHLRTPDGVENRLVGEYREVDPPKRLVYTWFWENDPAMGETLVTVEFVDRGKTTEVILTHDLFPSKEICRLHEAGWTGSFEKLAAIL